MWITVNGLNAQRSKYYSVICWKDYPLSSIKSILSPVQTSFIVIFIMSFLPFQLSTWFLNAMFRTFNFILNDSSKSGHSYLVPDLRRKAFRFPLLSVMLALDLSYMVFIMLVHIPSITILLTFLSWKDTKFCQMIFLHLLRCIIFILHFNNVVC